MENQNKPSMIEHLAESIHNTFDTKIIFSKPVEKHGTLIIPVAKVMYGFGGGSGHENSRKGKGGGAGVIAKPIGFIEITKEQTRFVSISHPVSYPALIFAGGIATYIILKGISKFLKKK